MECYVCAEEGVKKNAVALCIVCGMGLCRDHALREELPLWIGRDSRPTTDETEPSKQLEKTLPRIVCSYCYEALKTNFACC